MAITLIRTQKDNTWNNPMFKTIKIIVEKETGEEGSREIILGQVTVVDDQLKSIGDDIKIEMSSSEEEFHRKLRTQAAEKNQLITSHSTDPEWNPEGYVKNLK